MELSELVAQYGVQCATTGNLAPSKELADALAHNAAKRQEPVAWMKESTFVTPDSPNGPAEYEKEIEFMDALELSDTKGWTPLYASPPTLDEARELVEFLTFNVAMELDVWSKCNDFLARTK